MESNTYRSFTSFQGIEPPEVHSQESDVSQDAASAEPPPADWTVYSPNVTRGRLLGAEDPEDARSHLGWREDATRALAAEKKSFLTPSSQQPDPSGDVMLDEAVTPRASDGLSSATALPHPTLSLPAPGLTLDFRMSVTLNPRVSLGSVPFGHRNWISFTGGSWSGSWGSGIVMPGGQDSQIIIPDGSAYLDTNYLLQTHDDPPAHIVIKTHGWRTGPPDVLAQLADPKLADSVDPKAYKFRIFISMETGDERYKDRLNCGMWVGSGMRKGAEVIYDAYRVS
ncbi:hypothetical protein BP6252_04553 [Coleophoma cylindrospora]|uniref:Uncharacterized protein n=1 Tax=Coleophoma cylindrospora TaxID=1849047 RepID=A0A3D8S0V5_9HELO|nr:hypothetical protein BP6252_04553 [Coleophoma cylindrospora]